MVEEVLQQMMHREMRYAQEWWCRGVGFIDDPFLWTDPSFGR